jgi:ribosomal protein L37E
VRNETVNRVFLEAIWSALSEDQWRSVNELKAVSGADENTLMRIVDFLSRWNFVEVRRSPSLHLKRRMGAMSPTEVVGLLRAVSQPSETGTVTMPKRGLRLAERVACQLCGGRSFHVVGENEVECTTCHEEQWYAIDIPASEKVDFESDQSMLTRAIMRLHIPRRRA